MPVTRVLAAVPVADMAVAVGWYAGLFGRPPDDAPMPEAAEWRVPGGGAVQLVLDPGRAGRGLLTLGTDDLDALAAELAARVIVATPQDTPSGMFRVAALADPAGNRITLAQDLRGGDESADGPAA